MYKIALDRRASSKKNRSTKMSSKYNILVEMMDIGRNTWCKIDLNPSDFTKYDDGGRRIEYNRHDHVEDSAHYKSIVASQVLMSDEDRSFTPAAVIGGKVYSIKNDKLVFNDIDSEQQAWEYLPSSRTITPLIRGCHPALTGHKGLLYILGCRDGGSVSDSDSDSDSDSQFGFIFDPQHDTWVSITKPNANILFRRSYLAASILDSILLIDRDPWIVDRDPHESRVRRSKPYILIDGGKWIPYKCNRDLYSHLSDMNKSGKLAVVDEESTVYWIGNNGRIYAHNFETSETQCGPVFGLEHTDFLESLLEGKIEVPLFHLEGDLFCILCEDYTSRYKPTSELHCLVARLVKCESYVLMIVIGCFRAPISGICNLRNSFLMCQGN